MKSKITFYTRSTCPLCDKAKADLLEVRNDIDFVLEEIDISTSDELTERYGLMIPVILIDGIEAGYGHVNKIFIRNRLQEKSSNL